uniref:Uncharacterized protein n=1 Tax=Triticum aestivum TaxID=4565 RepID=A0A077S7L1_WHEAT|nr:unnamed protein product [Triticum aestivum]
MAKGSSQPPRHIDIDGHDVDALSPLTPLLFHHSLHWCADDVITVFDTTTESFGEMLAPHGADQFVMHEIYGKRRRKPCQGEASCPPLTGIVRFQSMEEKRFDLYEFSVIIDYTMVFLPLFFLQIKDHLCRADSKGLFLETDANATAQKASGHGLEGAGSFTEQV